MLYKETLQQHLSAFTALAQDVPHEYWGAEHFLQERPHKWKWSAAHWRGDQLTAYLIASQPEPSRVHVHHLMVQAWERRQGHGSRLLAQLEAQAHAENIMTLTAHVHRSNRAGLRFYTQRGFLYLVRDAHYYTVTKYLTPPAGRTLAVHQPNYLPWWGYFQKMAQSDVFVFFDTAQFPKGGYTNRVQIAEGAWLTLPVSVSLGQTIREVSVVDGAWRTRHLDRLATAYRHTPHWHDVQPVLAAVFDDATGSLAGINETIILGIAERLGIAPEITRSAWLPVQDEHATAYLVKVAQRLTPHGVYLSGQGARDYLESERFAQGGLTLRYQEPQPPLQPAYSIVDVLCHLGWARTAELLHGGVE